MRLFQVVLAVLIAGSAGMYRVVDPGRQLYALVGLNILLVAAQAVLSYRSASSARSARIERTAEVNNMLAPLASSLSRIPSRGDLVERERGVAIFLADATSASVGVTGAGGVRATFFCVREDEGSRVFVPWDSKGRGDQPVSRFREDDGAEGAEVWRLAESGEPRFVKNTKRQRIPYFDTSRKRKYRTFITVPVIVGTEVAGLLTINAPKPGDLVAEDIETMRTVADLMATALGMVDGKCPPRA